MTFGSAKQRLSTEGAFCNAGCAGFTRNSGAPPTDPETGMPTDYVHKTGQDLIKKTQRQNTRDLEIGLGKTTKDPTIKKTGTEAPKGQEADGVKMPKGGKL